MVARSPAAPAKSRWLAATAGGIALAPWS